jgi:proteasome lid subunit RPN8/RPN11
MWNTLRTIKMHGFLVLYPNDVVFIKPHASTYIYTPSEDATKIVQQICDETGLLFLGVIHSHPGGLDRPSSGDINV